MFYIRGDASGGSLHIFDQVKVEVFGFEHIGAVAYSGAGLFGQCGDTSVEHFSFVLRVGVFRDLIEHADGMDVGTQFVMQVGREAILDSADLSHAKYAVN